MECRGQEEEKSQQKPHRNCRALKIGLEQTFFGMKDIYHIVENLSMTLLRSVRHGYVLYITEIESGIENWCKKIVINENRIGIKTLDLLTTRY